MFKKWEISSVDKELAKQLAEECDVDPFVALIAASRGYTDAESLEEFLSEEGLFADVYELSDIKKAADIINESINAGEKIAIYGDYDCDGVTATAILYLYLQSRGVTAACYIPDRIEEGYGMTKKGVDALYSQGVKLIITVDNGISCFDEIEYAKNLGIKVVVTDHHLPPENIPLADAVVDPHLNNSFCFLKDICGAAVAFKLVCALENAEPEEMIFYYGDLAAIGTIGDVMPLKYENRAIVKNGLNSLKENLRPGIVALLELCSVDINDIDATKIAFSIVPRLNAAGRMGSALRALKLLVTDSCDEANALALEIFNENVNRQQIEKEILNEAILKVESTGISKNRIIVVDGNDWHMGVIGIVASRLCEKYGKPAIVFSNQGEISCGSGRSIEGFSLYDAINSCADMLLKFGGHEQAAGVTISIDKIKDFSAAVNKYADTLPLTYPVLHLDCKLNPAALGIELAESLAALKPYGHGNGIPVFGIYGVCIERITSIGNNKHIRLLLSKGDISFQAVRFSVSADVFEFNVGDIVDLAVQLDINLYNEKEYLSVVIKDIRAFGTNDIAALDSLNMYNEFCLGKTVDSAMLLPTRDEFAFVYKYLTKKSCSENALVLRFAPQIFAGKIKVIIAALKQLSLIKEVCLEDTVVLETVPAENKVDLHAADIIKSLE